MLSVNRIYRNGKIELPDEVDIKKEMKMILAFPEKERQALQKNEPSFNEINP